MLDVLDPVTLGLCLVAGVAVGGVLVALLEKLDREEPMPEILMMPAIIARGPSADPPCHRAGLVVADLGRASCKHQRVRLVWFPGTLPLTDFPALGPALVVRACSDCRPEWN